MSKRCRNYCCLERSNAAKPSRQAQKVEHCRLPQAKKRVRLSLPPTIFLQDRTAHSRVPRSQPKLEPTQHRIAVTRKTAGRWYVRVQGARWLEAERIRSNSHQRRTRLLIAVLHEPFACLFWKHAKLQHGTVDLTRVRVRGFDGADEAAAFSHSFLQVFLDRQYYQVAALVA